MKYLALFITAFSLGYITYGLLHPVDKKPFKDFLNSSARDYANSTSPEEKLRTADEMYGQMMLMFLSQLDLKAMPNKPVNVQVNIQPEKKIAVEVPKEIRVPVPVIKEEITQKEKPSHKVPALFKNMSSWSVIDSKDSRISKLNGTFRGKLKRRGATRTGLLENVVFEVNQDPEKAMTKLESTDVYDNTTMNYYRETSQTFKSVPGDENLLMLMLDNFNFVVFDLRKFPALDGKIYDGKNLSGEFDLKKKAK
ncbi:MAG: hypothetical protein ACJ749_01585 [Flavisolibacter sp.]